MRIWDLPTTERDAIAFFQERNILPKTKKCRNNHEMKLYFGKQNFWQCNLRECAQQVGLRKDNWFESTKIPFLSALRFIYFWSLEFTSIKFCKEQLDLSNKTITDWNLFMRELCVLDMANRTNKKIGGPGCIVEIGESSLSKTKNNHGRLETERLFGGVCKETNDIFIVIIPIDRNGSTIIDKIIENIADGSTICSDNWKKYQINQIEIEGFFQAQVNHGYNFIDPNDEVNTQTVKRMWGSAKLRHQDRRGTARNYLDSYLTEFIWRHNQLKENKDCFESILNIISVNFQNKSR